MRSITDMAFIIYSARGGEVERRQLGGKLVVGRSPGCDIAIHDILASRQHCRLEPSRGGWTVVDLNSRNGTRVNGEKVSRRPLRDGDILNIGKTTVRFQMGKVGAGPSTTAVARARPADPHAALAETVVEFDAAEAARVQRRHNWPTPKPVPADPEAYARDNLYAMMSEIASSSWDSIYAGASRPNVATAATAATAMSTVAVEVPRAKVRRPKTPLEAMPTTRALSLKSWMRDVAASITRGIERAREWLQPRAMARAR